MIVYFADRQLNIIGQASTGLPNGLVISGDRKTGEIETGVSSFEFDISYDKKTRSLVEECTQVGNYIMRSHDGENELYTIIEAEIDTKKQQVYIYAEDDGMDLLNEVVGVYEADKAYPIAHYINKYAAGAGFVIGINEAKDLTRKLSWDGESTATERIASVATQFDGCEISFSFEIDGLNVVKKYINIYKERGKDIGVTLRLNQDIDNIITTKSIANLATALQCKGGTPEDDNVEDDIEPTAITLSGYKYDDGDFYVDGTLLKSRQALKKWSRFLWKTEESQKAGGHIVKPYSYDTLSQATLCSHAITELKKIREMEVNYEVDITKFPDNVKIGDRINIVDDAGELYVSARVLKLEQSVADQEHKATLGEYLIKGSGIHQKVADLAEQFAKNSVSAARALAIAKNATTTAKAAQAQADSALGDSKTAQQVAEAAQQAANSANESASLAQEKAAAAEQAVDKVEKSVAGLETTVANAQAAAEQAQQAAQTAETKANEAQRAAVNAQAKADEAATAAGNAQTKADSATAKADTAKSEAEQAIADAEAAATAAAAAKLDAENAQKDIDAFGESLTTLENTMTAKYARKTDLTKTEASLQTQITQNANEISSTATRVQEIDETANNAAQQAQAAQTAAGAAQAQADQATADAQAAQTAADNAAAAATAAQSEADTANAAAATAQGVADKAEADLETAKADLVTVTSRVDSTEEEIAAAQQAVEAAQTAADNAQAEADAAAKKATDAQSTADTAVTNAANAQSAANEAASKANLAQQTADAAKSDAATAQAKADEAAETAAEAQRTANTAVTNAATAQAAADKAKQDAAAAQKAADDADSKAAQAATDLATAKQNLADVTSRVDATEEEVAAAQQAVQTAQAAADKAKQDAQTAQSTADTAKANAATAQTAANNAKAAADRAQADATAAQQAADKAQADVNALAVRVTTAETNIEQNAEQIALRATKTEVAQTLGGYYTKEQTDAAITEKADEINLSVSEVRTEVENINVGGRNLIANTSLDTVYSGSKGSSTYKDVWAARTIDVPTATEYVVSFDAKADAEQSIQCFFYSPNTTLTSESSTGDHRSNVADGVSYVDITTEWNRYWVKWTQNAADAVKSVIVGRTFTDNTIYIRSVKLEEGNRATSWSPAPEDFYTRTETDAKIQVSSDSITSSVSATYATKTALSATDTKAVNAANAAAAAQNDIDNLNIGGRNLLLNTNGTGDIIVDGGTLATAGITQHTNDGVLTLACATESTEIYYRFMSPSISANNLYSLKTGETYTFSGKAMITATSGTLVGLVVRSQAYRLGGWSGGIQKAIATANTDDWVDFEYSFTVESDATGYYLSFQINYSGSFAAVAQFKDLKLEHGTRATDWTPAPEDVESGINDAQNAADEAQNTANNNATNIAVAETTIQQLADSIEALVRDGNGGSLIRQDSNGLWYFNIGEIEKNISDTANNLDDLEGIVLDANGEIDVLKSTAAALQERTEYVRSYTDENGQPCLELGEGDSVFKVRITNTEIQFAEDAAIPTRINRQMLVIEKAMVRNELQFGDDQEVDGVWIWKRRSNGNLGLMWKEVAN